MYRWNAFAFVILPCSALVGACSSNDGLGETDQALTLRATIQVPGDAVANPAGKLSAFDISYWDETNRRFYLSDRANAGVDVIDTERNAYLFRVGGFKGNADHDHTGPNGVVPVGDQELWASDGDSTVKVIDLSAKKIVDTISTGGASRADELSYDPEDGILLVVNNAEETTDDPSSGSFATLISTREGHKVLGKLLFHEASGGLEQSVWDPDAKRFYLAIPELDDDPAKGAIAVIDPKSATVSKLFPVAECATAGIALGPNGHLLLGCSGDAIDAGFAAKSLVMNIHDGSIVSTIKEVGGSDEVWFNPGDNRYYLAARDNPDGPVLGVVDALTDGWLGNIVTTTNAKSVAADRISNHVFVPLTATGEPFANDAANGLSCTNGCVGVFSH